MKIIKRLPGLPIERALGLLAGRWKAVILHVLLDGPQRTRELEKRIAGVSQKVLIEQLRALEEHGLVLRLPVDGDPQGIEYRLTPFGSSLRPLLESLMDWGTRHAVERNEAHALVPCEAVVRARAQVQGTNSGDRKSAPRATKSASARTPVDRRSVLGAQRVLPSHTV